LYLISSSQFAIDRVKKKTPFVRIDMYTVVSKALEMYPKPQLMRDQARDERELVVPFEEISGEAVQFIGETAETDGIIALSNYRLHITRSPGQLQSQDHQVISDAFIFQLCLL